MDEQALTGLLSLIGFALRIVGVVYCSQKAARLNRSSGGWGVFGFFLPIIAMIWIQFMKPIIKWENQSPPQVDQSSQAG